MTTPRMAFAVRVTVTSTPSEVAYLAEQILTTIDRCTQDEHAPTVALDGVDLEPTFLAHLTQETR